MRQVSLKRQRRNRAVKPVRDAYRAEFPICQWCHSEPATELHEISRGPARDASLDQRAALLHLGHECHIWIAVIPPAGQLAIKKLAADSYYDRVTVNRLRGRADQSITEREVDDWVRRFRL